MKRYIYSLMSFFLVSAVVVIPVFAQDLPQAGKSVSLDKNTVISDNYYAAGSVVKVSGTVNGDVYVAGGNITVDGTVKGDVLAAGGNVSISGNVLGNVRVFGGQTNISGTVGKNISIAGGQAAITKDAKISGSVSVAGGELSIATVIPGQVVFAGGQLSLGPASKLKNLTLYSQHDASVLPGASVSGQIQKYSPPAPSEKQIHTAKKAANTASSFFTIMSFISALAFGLLITRFFPGLVNSVSAKLETRFWTRLGIGFLSLCLLPFAFFALIVTLVGIPFAFISLSIYALLFYFSRIFVAVFVGRWINRQFNLSSSLPLALLTGLVLYYLFGLIPVFGFLVRSGLTLAAVGSLIWPGQTVTPSPTSPSPSPVAPEVSPRRLAKK